MNVKVRSPFSPFSITGYYMQGVLASCNNVAWTVMLSCHECPFDWHVLFEFVFVFEFEFVRVVSLIMPKFERHLNMDERQGAKYACPSLTWSQDPRSSMPIQGSNKPYPSTNSAHFKTRIRLHKLHLLTACHQFCENC